jgi:hypothetical protein
MLGAVTAIPGVVVVGEGANMVGIHASNGQYYFIYQDPNNTNANPAYFFGSSTISHGTLLIGDNIQPTLPSTTTTGYLYAFTPPS